MTKSEGAKTMRGSKESDCRLQQRDITNTVLHLCIMGQKIFFLMKCFMTISFYFKQSEMPLRILSKGEKYTD